MKKYLTVEVLKTKRTIIRKMIFFIPILCILIACVFSYLGGEGSVKLAFLSSLNHWSLVWMPALIVLSAGLFHNLEEHATEYKTIFSLPIDLKKSWISKNIILALFTLTASAFLGILFIALKVTIINTPTDIVPFYNCFIAIIISWILTLWQIPLCLWLSQKINVFILMLISCAANLELGAGKAPSSLWWLDPWSWPLRLQSPLIHLHPNGILLESNSILLNPSVIPLGIGLSILLFMALLIFTSFLFQRQEVH